MRNNFNGEVLPEDKLLWNKCFIDQGIIGLIFGVLYGIILTPAELNHNCCN